MSPGVKICGTTGRDDAQLAVDAGADMVGFVFAHSRRQVTVAQVRAITAGLPAGVAAVGVFTTTDADEILSAANASGITIVQLHSLYDPGLVARIKGESGGRLRVLQVVAVPSEAAEASLTEVEDTLRKLSSQEDADVLLDASVKGHSGGTGVPFDWERTGKLLRRVWNYDGLPMLGLAGGLHAENVRAAVDVIRPDFVDVVSGVEVSPGVKDARKLYDFVRAVAAAK